MSCTGSRSERSDWYGDLKELQIRFEKLKKNEKKKNSVSESSQKLAEEIERLLGNLLQLDERRTETVFNIEIWKRGEIERLRERFQSENNKLKEQRGRVESENNNLNEKIKKAVSERDNLKQKLGENEKIIAGLDTRIKSFEKDNTQLREQCDKVTKESRNLELKLAQEQGNINDLQTKVDRLQNENNNLEEQRKKVASERDNLKLNLSEDCKIIADLETRIVRLEKEVEDTSKLFENAKIENQNLQKELSEKTLECHWVLEAQNKQIDNFKRNLNEQRNSIDKLQRNLSEEKKAKENALNRLSAAAANRLRDQNPGITDLSDPNRPLKLAEKVSELYDNEWTNAMENLEGELDMHEDKGIKLLLKIIKNVFDTCAEFGDAHLAAFPDMLILPPSILQRAKERTLYTRDLPAEILKPMKDFRKSQAKHAINHLRKYFSSNDGKSKLRISKKKFNTCKEYIDKCVELCWMMRIQDPPIYMETDYPTNSEFDSSRMRSYTKAGRFVNFVVWPTFFLHKDGPLLGKGVVQGSKNEVENIEESNSEAGSSCSDESDDNFDDARSRTDSDLKEDASTYAQKPKLEDGETTSGAGKSQSNSTEGNPEEPIAEEPISEEPIPEEPIPEEPIPGKLYLEEPNGDEYSGQPEGSVKEGTRHKKVKEVWNNSEGADSKEEIKTEDDHNDKLTNDDEDCGE
ncbi:myosin heavy chain, striated muscle-like isoform X2 [Ostrea edulis]|uniref:myosin heavy chain, striated muscle-like isoform X2 n=1 Tax=Ostrea edulis TaxID=37623 RepID=UPI00209429B9|nr:myosin heavy chain, striated muscle-like isoform X2 [Ostrea edulis]